MNVMSSFSTDAATLVKAPRLVEPASAGLQSVQHYRNARIVFDKIYEELDEAQGIASKTHGHRPIALIAWRDYSAIGAGEIEQMRDRLLAAGENAQSVDREYKAAKKRYREVIRAGKDWDRKAGLQTLMFQQEEARAELEAAKKAIAALNPISLEEAAALIGLVQEGVHQFENIEKWEASALANANQFLRHHVGLTSHALDKRIDAETRCFAKAFSRLESDLCDLTRMARLAELQVHEAIGELKHDGGICVEVPDTENAELATFAVSLLVDRVRGLEREWYRLHNEGCRAPD